MRQIIKGYPNMLLYGWRYINDVLTKKNLRDIIGRVLSVTNVPTTAAFLDNMKDMGYKFAFKGGLSFSLGDIIIPEKEFLPTTTWV